MDFLNYKNGFFINIVYLRRVKNYFSRPYEHPFEVNQNAQQRFYDGKNLSRIT